MATSLQALNASLPDGLEQQPYFGQQFGSTDDDPDGASVYEEEGASGSGVRRARRRLRGDGRSGSRRTRMRSALSAVADLRSNAAAAARAKAAESMSTTTGAYRAHLLASGAPRSS